MHARLIADRSRACSCLAGANFFHAMLAQDKLSCETTLGDLMQLYHISFGCGSSRGSPPWLSSLTPHTLSPLVPYGNFIGGWLGFWQSPSVLHFARKWCDWRGDFHTVPRPCRRALTVACELPVPIQVGVGGRVDASMGGPAVLDCRAVDDGGERHNARLDPTAKRALPARQGTLPMRRQRCGEGGEDHAGLWGARQRGELGAPAALAAASARAQEDYRVVRERSGGGDTC